MSEGTSLQLQFMKPFHRNIQNNTHSPAEHHIRRSESAPFFRNAGTNISKDKPGMSNTHHHSLFRHADDHTFPDRHSNLKKPEQKRA